MLLILLFLGGAAFVLVAVAVLIGLGHRIEPILAARAARRAQGSNVTYLEGRRP